jgi:hypothetical protein
MSATITPEIKTFILENYLLMSRGAIAKKFTLTKQVLKTFYSKNALVVSKEVIEGFRCQALRNKTSFTDKEDQYIKDNYLTIPVKTIGQHLQRSGCGINGRLKKLNLVIPEAIIQQRKIDSVFKPGQIPINKGKKQSEYMSSEAIERTKATRFQSGQIPKNALPDGMEVLRPDKRSGKVYTMIKVPGISKLKYKQVHVWETHHKKKVPPGHNIVFADGNTQNFEPENLECITDEVLMTRNTIQRYPEDIKTNIRLISKIKKVIYENTTRNQD